LGALIAIAQTSDGAPAPNAAVHRALVLVASSFLNSKDPDEMVVDALDACAKLPAKIAERQEIAELTRHYNLPDTEEETQAS
jgi:hypothetical protein